MKTEKSIFSAEKSMKLDKQEESSINRQILYMISFKCHYSLLLFTRHCCQSCYCLFNKITERKKNHRSMWHCLLIEGDERGN